MSHLGGELFKQLAGIKEMVHVPYKGAGPGIGDLVAGHIPAMSPNITTNLIGLHQSGKIRILSVHSEKRLSGLPDVPTSMEQGMPDNMIAELFLGIYAAPKTPARYVDKVAERDARGGGRQVLPGGAAEVRLRTDPQFGPRTRTQIRRPAGQALGARRQGGGPSQGEGLTGPAAGFDVIEEAGGHLVILSAGRRPAAAGQSPSYE